MKNPRDRRLYSKRYRDKPGYKEKQSTYYAEWRIKNKERIVRQQREYREKNRDQRLADKIAYAAAHKAEKAAYDLAYRAARKEALAAWQKQYHIDHPEIKGAMARNRKAMMRGAGGKHTAAEIKALYASQGGKCVYCWASLDYGYHGDHIIPVSRGGTNWITNIQLLCPPCNIRKHDLLPDEFTAKYKITSASCRG